MGCRSLIYFLCVLEMEPAKGEWSKPTPHCLVRRCSPYSLTNPILGSLGDHNTEGIFIGLLRIDKSHEDFSYSQ